MTPAKDAAVFSVTPLSDKEIVIRRVFNAPKQLVFDALTKPEMLRNWFWGPDGWTLAVCDVDLTVGGETRYVWQKGDTQMGMSSICLEIDPPNRMVSRERFDDPWYQGEAVGTMELTEDSGKTTLTTTMKYETEAARDSVLKSPMDEGLAVGYRRLETYLVHSHNSMAKRTQMQKITTFLMFNDQAEEAMNFYASIFKNSKIVNTMPGPGGSVIGGTLELAGQTFNVFNGGPRFGFAEGMSLLVNCEDQKEIDHYWEKLTADGGEESMCGWLKDKFGVSWQIVPTILGEMLQDRDPAKSKRVVDAFLKMKRFDIQALKDAYEGKTA